MDLDDPGVICNLISTAPTVTARRHQLTPDIISVLVRYEMCSSLDIDYFHRYLTTPETTQICERFHGTTWQPGRQVMWSGVPRTTAQQWADTHGMQTLTTAMGPLMVHDHPRCLQSRKSKHRWSEYIHGASALFAYHIAQDGGTVTVLTPRPPQRFNPHGETNYQAIEEPILKGALGPCHVEKIELVHPTVLGAEEFQYQIWPEDETASWDAEFATATDSAPPHPWRHPKPNRAKL